jgi:hypothetical protein
MFDRAVAMTVDNGLLSITNSPGLELAHGAADPGVARARRSGYLCEQIGRQQPPAVLLTAHRMIARRLLSGTGTGAAALRENASMTRLRATASHQIPDRPPIQVVPGQQVRVGQRDTEWPAFVFITTGTGAGWVPERYLDTSSDPAVALTSYDTTELATTAGEELILIERDGPSGWARVRNAAGSEGWVPLRTIEPVPGD